MSLYSLGYYGFLLRMGLGSLGLAFFSLVTGLLSESRKTIPYYADLAEDPRTRGFSVTVSGSTGYTRSDSSDEN